MIELLRKYSNNFWILNLIQFIERFAYWNLLVQMPVYLAQKDAVGGLHLEQTTKGTIFFIWALLQNLFPFFSGSYTDRIGNKKVMVYAFLLIIISYLLIALFQNLIVVIGALLILALGVGGLKPALQGALAKELNTENAKSGWGLYFLILNVAILLSSLFSKLMKDISFQLVFFSSVAIVSISLLLLIFYRVKENETNSSIKEIRGLEPLKEAFSTFSKPKYLFLILILSGFYFIYIQFYYTLPNFISDWSSSASFQSSGLPAWVGMHSDRGIIFSYEWVYVFNSLLTILFIMSTTKIFQNQNTFKVFQISLLLASIGIFLCGISMNLPALIIGAIIYTFGEMIFNPKLTQYFSEIAPPEKKSMYLGFISVPLAIGFTIGSILGSGLYEIFSEKATLAKNYLQEFFHTTNIELSSAFNILQEKTFFDAVSLTEMLWSYYSPYISFSLYALVGVISLLCLVFYTKKYAKKH